MTSVVLFSDADFDRFLSFESPSKNASGPEYSCFSRNPGARLQCARVEDARKPRVRRLLGGRDGARGVLLELRTDEQREWFQELQAQIVCAMAAKCEEWFGRSLPIEDVRAMLKPFLTSVDDGRGVAAQLRVSKDARLFLNAAAKSPERMEWDELAPGMPCIPMVKVEGLWVSQENFGAVLSVTDLMAFEEEGKEEEEAEEAEEADDLSRAPFVRPASEDLRNDEAMWEQVREAPLDDDDASFHTRNPFGTGASSRAAFPDPSDPHLHGGGSS